MAATSVMGVFEKREQAEEAVKALEKEGFSDRNVSIVGKGDNQQNAGDNQQNAGENQGNQNGNQGINLGRGTTWGAGVGTATGLLATAGALTIPGIGPLIALGPLAAALGGAATGGVAGSLVDWGIPEQRGRQAEEDIRQGRFLAVVEADGKVEKAQEVLRNQGAREVEKFERNR